MRRTVSDFNDDYHYPMITVGIVEDVSDANQLGRMRVRCPAWQDGDTPTRNLPLVQLSAPFFGYGTTTPRGVNEIVSAGPVAYGQWFIPKVGSQVMVTLIDNDINQRVFLGCVPELYLSHTLPHGRYLEDRIPKTSAEFNLEPLATNTGIAFNDDRTSAEYATRVMDRQVTAYPESEFGSTIVASEEADQQNQTIENPDGSIIDRTQGYVDGDSKIYATTTPGMHSMVMDDDPNNCRMRFRTTSGNQVIMDDTNERIYISTAKGKTWIEIDEKGTIDIYGEQEVSISSDADVNISAKENVRISGGKGIHMTSGKDIRMHSKEDTSIKTDADLKTYSANLKIETGEDMLVKVAGKQDTNAKSIITATEAAYDLTVGTNYVMTSVGYQFDGKSITAALGDVFSVNSYATVSMVTATVTGTAAVTSGGAVSAADGLSAGGNVTASGTMSSTGSITTQGIISSSTDVIAGQTSLRSHVHMVPLPATAAGMIPSQLATPTAASLPVVVEPITPPLAMGDPVGSFPEGSTADSSEALPAYFPSRIPQHEPYTRSYLKKEETDKDDASESTLDLFDAVKNDIDTVLEYDSKNNLVGKGSAARGKDFARNSKWRR